MLRGLKVKDSRSRAITRIGRFLLRRGIPRIQMTIMVAATGLTGFLFSAWLLHLQVHSMWIRYPLAVIFAYTIFLLILRFWLYYWAGKNGPNTRNLATCIMETRKHPEQGFRSCLGIMKLVKQYSAERVEAACSRALLLKAYSYKSVESILKNNLDKQELPESSSPEKQIIHYNIRGREYYQQKEAAHA